MKFAFLVYPKNNTASFSESHQANKGNLHYLSGST